MSKTLSHNIAYNAVTPEVFRTFDMCGIDDIANMFQYFESEKEFSASHDVDLARSINPEPQTSDQWLQTNAALIPLP
jgi:hypothetical protein